MPHTRITINGQTIIDDMLDTWHKQPPQLLAEATKPGGSAQPGMAALMVTLSQAALKQEPIDLILHTSDDGFILTAATP